MKTVRIRKLPNNKHGKSSDNSSNSSSSSETSPKKVFGISSFWKSIIGCVCLAVAVYIGALGYLETRVNTPFDDEKIITESGISVPEMYWGSYRPGVYFGMKTRDPRSPVFGLMWYDPTERHKGIRHWCEQGDNLPSYGWIRHDGLTFGEQVIEDPPFTIVTSFIKVPGGERGGQWTSRIDVQLKNHNGTAPISLIWYAALDEALGPAAPHSRIWAEGGEILGHTPSLGNFKNTLVRHKGRVLYTSFAEANTPGLHLLKEELYSLFEVAGKGTPEQRIVLTSDQELNEGKDINFVAYQWTVEAPFTLDIVHIAEDVPTPPLHKETYSNALSEKRKAFDKEFEAKFKLEKKGYSKENVAIARAAMSNMIGGIGYFYGAGRVQSQYTKESVPYWRAPLYTGVPSRSFFPRGFLWDEGFHGLLIGRWSPSIQLDIAAHWFDLLNVEGWIPREQILGAEALARVPKEFVVQNNAAANPPMFLLQLAHTVKTRPELFSTRSKHRRTLERMFTRLQAWYQWFITTQRGLEPTSYMWRGRVDDGLQLNPKTLSSGVDDYPRASHPSDIERHVDLRCWMYAAADSMTVIANILQRDTSKFEAMRDQLGDEDLLNELHWSSHSQQYADYGLHTDGVKLVKQPAKPSETSKMVRIITSPPKPRLVTSAYGYITLFPMLLKVLKPKSPKLGIILNDLDKTDLLWSPYGLRSLSKSSPWYMKRNTEHDPPYWRGQVWLNINYLALSALRYYSNTPGPYAVRANTIHVALRDNLVKNVLSQYKKTGYFWEQYSGEDGKGSGCRPFTGWTGLIVLIMAEEY